MNNQVFRKQSTRKNKKKLDVLLRRLTDDALTDEQRRRLRYALSHHRQYHLRLCTSKSSFGQASDPDSVQNRSGTVRILLDGTECPNGAPLAALVRRRTAGKRENTLYLYLPKLKGERRDETRTKETKEA